METINVTTPSGYVATIRQSLTFDQYERIQSIITSGIEMDAKTKKAKVDGEAVYQANRKAMELLVVKLVDKDGKELPAIETISNMDVEDGAVIKDVIMDIRAKAEPSKKNATT